MQPGCIGDAEDGAFGREQAAHGLAPRFGPRGMEQALAVRTQLGLRSSDGSRAFDFQFEAQLRDGVFFGPCALSEAGFSGHTPKCLLPAMRSLNT